MAFIKNSWSKEKKDKIRKRSEILSNIDREREKYERYFYLVDCNLRPKEILQSLKTHYTLTEKDMKIMFGDTCL